MPRYAEKTQVTPEKSRIEIERILQRYGADQFVYGWDGDRAALGFRYQGIMVRFKISLPDRKDFESSPTGRSRTESAAQQAYDQAVRQRWRALALCIKAKLEAVDSGITTFQDEFLAYTVLPDGSTVGEWIAPQLVEAYETATMPKLLPLLEEV